MFQYFHGKRQELYNNYLDTKMIEEDYCFY